MEQLTIFDFLSAPAQVEIPQEAGENVILSSSIAFKEAKGFEYVRECDRHLMKMWYGIIPGPLGTESTYLVLKEHYSFIHVRIFESEAKLRKWLEKEFKKQLNDNGYTETKSLIGDFIGVIPDMYKCNASSDWDYAEKEYSGCMDYQYDVAC